MKKGRRDAGFGKKKTAIILGLALCVALLAVCCVLVVKIVQNLKGSAQPEGPAVSMEEPGETPEESEDPGLATIEANTVLRDGTVAGVELSGLTMEQARTAILEALENKDDHLTVTLPDRKLEFRNVCTWALPDVDDVLQSIYDSGSDKVTVKLETQLDTDAIREIVEQAAEDVKCEPEEPSFEVDQETEELVVHVGKTGLALETEELMDAITAAYESGEPEDFEWEYEETASEALDPQTMYDNLCIEAVSSTWDKENKTTTPSRTGYAFDLEEAEKLLGKAEPGDEVRLKIIVTEPEVTQEYLNGVIFRDILGTTTASQSSSSNRANNLNLASGRGRHRAGARRDLLLQRHHRRAYLRQGLPLRRRLRQRRSGGGDRRRRLPGGLLPVLHRAEIQSGDRLPHHAYVRRQLRAHRHGRHCGLPLRTGYEIPQQHRLPHPHQRLRQRRHRDRHLLRYQ